MFNIPRRAVVGVALAAAALAGCSEPAPPAEPTAAPATSAGTTSPADVATPDSVVDAAAAVYWAADTTTDTSPRDAARRADDWLTPAHAARVNEDLPGNPGADWLTLTEHHGRYEVTATDATDAMPELPADTATAASRGRIITLTPTGADGWTGTPRVLVVRFDLARSSAADPWLIDTITVSETAADVDTMQDYG